MDRHTESTENTGVEDIKVDKITDELSPISRESSVGFVLIFVAGWVNIEGLKWGIVDSLSYVTGRGVRMGMAIFEGDVSTLLYALGTLISFVLGSYIGARATSKKGIGFSLLITSFFLFLVSLIVISREYHLISKFFPSSEEFALTLTMVLTLISMGSMNGATSLTLIGRTTHLTGTATDIGLNLAIGKKKTAMFHLLRWVGLFMGAFVATCFYGLRSELASFLTFVPVLLVGAMGLVLCRKVTVK